MRGVLLLKGPGFGWDDVAGTAVSRTEGRCVLSKAEAEEWVILSYSYLSIYPTYLFLSVYLSYLKLVSNSIMIKKTQTLARTRAPQSGVRLTTDANTSPHAANRPELLHRWLTPSHTYPAARPPPWPDPGPWPRPRPLQPAAN